MIHKSTQKRITHLDLKFLDMSILSVNSDIPDILTTQKDKRKKEQTLINKYKTQQLSKYNKKNDQTIDATISQQISIQYKNDNIKCMNDEYSRPNIMEYISADISEIENQCTQKFHKQKLEKQKENNLWKQNNSLLLAPVQGKQLQKYPQDKMNRYLQATNQLQKQNQCIHKQIAKLYFTNQAVDLKNKYKPIKTMKIKSQSTNIQSSFNPISKIVAANILSKQYIKQGKAFKSTAMMEFNKYMADLEEQLIGTDKNGGNSPVSLDVQINTKKKIDKKKQLFKHQTTKPKIHKKIYNKQSTVGVGSSVLQQYESKYLNFYEQLYEQKRQKKAALLQTIKNEQNDSLGMGTKIDQNQRISQELLEDVRKKIINSNIDKNLESYLNEKKIRVPGLLRYLR